MSSEDFFINLALFAAKHFTAAKRIIFLLAYPIFSGFQDENKSPFRAR